MSKRTFFAALVLCLFACNEKSSNPVLPTSPGGTPPASEVTVTVATDHGQLEAGSAGPATLTVTARRRDGTPPPDATDVTVNTTLGSFGVDAAGAPLQIVTRPLTGGTAALQFYAGKQTGVASILAQVGTAMGKLNVPIVTPSPAPVADFTYEVKDLQVAFTDASTGAPASHRWNFGDASPASAETNPVYTYKSASTYTVSLTVANAGGENTKTKFVSVTGPPMTVSFTADVHGRTVLFTDTSTGSPTKWAWEFGDGGTETAPNPSHTYIVPGSYPVKLTVTNGAGVQASGSRFVTTGSAPTADFAVQKDGLHALFTDTSTGGPTLWSWTFGDCTGCLPQQTRNAEHFYARSGTYTVTLTASNTAGSSTKSDLVTVSAGDPPKAAFTFVVHDLTVQFVDASTNNPTTRLWSFGDGGSSAEANPTHVYTKADTYTVTLKVSNAAGDSTAAEPVTVGSAPSADFTFAPAGLDVSFFDRSTNEPKSWTWEFGDGLTSPQQNPQHHFAASGSYPVALTATNAAGSSRVSKLVTVVGYPVARFTVAFGSGHAATFIDQSTDAATWSWNFGDCGTQPATCTSTARFPPTHVYAAANNYTVSLTVSNSTGSNSTMQTITVP